MLFVWEAIYYRVVIGKKVIIGKEGRVFMFYRMIF